MTEGIPQIRTAQFDEARLVPPRPPEPDEHEDDEPEVDLGPLVLAVGDRTEPNLLSSELTGKLGTPHIYEPIKPRQRRRFVSDMEEAEDPFALTSPVSLGPAKSYPMPFGPPMQVANQNLIGAISQYGQLIKRASGNTIGNIGQCRALDVQPPGGAKRSDHYWCGALDLALNAYDPIESRVGDNIKAWADRNASKGGGRPFKICLWKTKHHYDHVHISFWEGWTGALPAVPNFF